MSETLDRLCRILEPATRDAGFALSDAGPIHDEQSTMVERLEYRADDRGRPVLLDVYELVAERTITVELWRPEMLNRRGDAAVRRRAWHVSPAIDPADLAREIAAEVTTWLETFRHPATPDPWEFRPEVG